MSKTLKSTLLALSLIGAMVHTNEACAGPAASKDAVDTALKTTGHRQTGEWLAQDKHRTAAQWLGQGNHRNPLEWLMGVLSKNK